ncbi:MAG: hypothetical protein U9R79_13135 [Armatimonadota bacterium]|nr:hypothetical protein [Armatimonadota bacterium]
MRLSVIVSCAAMLLVSIGPGAGQQEPTEKQQADLNRLAREWGYIQQRAERAMEIVGETDGLQALADEAADRIERAAQADLSLLEGWHPLPDPGMREDLLEAAGLRQPHVTINRAIQGDADLLATFVDPWTRHKPTYVPPAEPVREWEIVSLQEESAAGAFTLSNASDQTLACSVVVEGLPEGDFDLMLRRHVYLETWYNRENTGIYDPLPRLPREGGAWRVQVPSGACVRLHLAVEVGESAGSADAPIIVRAGDSEQRLSLRLEVLPARPPEDAGLGYVAFAYPGLNVCGHSPELAAVDMGEHGTTIMEFPSMPAARWSAQGQVIEADFARHDARADAYLQHIGRMMIFWHGEIELEDGTVLAMHTPGWRQAFIDLLRTWLAHSAERGHRPERFCILVADELHSAHFDVAPDEHVREVVETMRQIKEHLPQLAILQTLTYYAFPADVELMAPVTDIAVVASRWPEQWPEQLTRNAPPEYNPLEAWREEIGPLLRERQAAGMELLSYHVASGKSDDLLRYNYAFPVVMLARGMTGVGHWAYNVARAGTWHDWDGEGAVRLDYSFIYDGAEDHERNRRLNPTGEIVVPSIRWEALREGNQVARLLLALRGARDGGELSDENDARVGSLWDEVRQLADAEELAAGGVSALSRRVREAWSAVRQ